MIPFTTAERKVLGVAAPSQPQTPLNWVYPPPPNPYGLQPRLTGFVNQIYVQAADRRRDVQPAMRAGHRTLLRAGHRIQPGGDNDFSVRNLSQIAETAEGSSRIMALLLAAVASISLVVGGIGIMNILLVSVTERTREIGLRMAIGARRLHVLLQFLAEAVFLSVTGGVAGIVMGVAFSLAISHCRRLAGADLAHARSPAGSCSPRRSGSSSATTRRARRRGSIRSRRCATSSRAPRQHALQYAVAHDEVVIERAEDMDTDQRQHHIIGGQAVHIAGPLPARRPCGDEVRQFVPEHDDRHAAKIRVDPAQQRHDEQQCESSQCTICDDVSCQAGMPGSGAGAPAPGGPAGERPRPPGRSRQR